MKKQLTTCLTLVALLTLAILVSSAGAYDRYSAGCNDCHGSFRASTYSSLAAAKSANPAWPGSLPLHNGHANASTGNPPGMLNNNCNACHFGTSRTPVYTYQSSGAAPFNGSCTGCHDGAGLRAHHENSGAATCYDCHSDPAPDPENVLRAVYAAAFGTTSGTTQVNDPCNPAAAGFEGRLKDVTGIGLDNDGNLLYDQNDPACAPAPAPKIGVSPATLTFGNQNAGTTSAAQTVTISNTGNAALTVNSISNSNATDFSVTSPATPFNVAAGASQTFTAAFKPATTGAKSATISITSNGGNASVSASGTGTTAPVPVLGVSPATLTFGNQTVGTTSAAQTVTISNTGTGTLNVTSISSSNAEFKFSPATLASIAPGGSAALSVTFAPIAPAGAKSATISITSDGGNGSVSASGTGTTPNVTVPNVVGMTQAAATTAITGASLTVGTVTTQSSTTVPAGQVISQNPAAGASVASGSAVNLVVSSGLPNVTVPNVVGMTQAAATTAITGASLTVGTVTTQSSTTVPAGQVISQNPAAGASVASGSAVNLVVSSGLPNVTVPNVVGMTQAAASTAITGASLTVGTVTTQSSTTVPAGQVISQNPAAAASVASGSAVNLVVSSGTGGTTQVGDVSLVKLTVPKQITARKGQTAEMDVLAEAITTAKEQKATVTLTAASAAGVSVRINHSSSTEQLKARDRSRKFDFEPKLTCTKKGTWPVTWTATIKAAQDSNPANNTLTGVTQVICKSQEERD